MQPEPPAVQPAPTEQTQVLPPVPSGPAAASAATTLGPVRGRSGLVVLVALLVEVIVIAAADNQWVAQRVSDNALNHQGSVSFDFAFALLTYQWRFSRAGGDAFHTLYGQYFLLAIVLIGTAVLVSLLRRGPLTFWRVFLGTWSAVIAATVVGAIGRGLVTDSRLMQGQSRWQFALFSDIGPSQYVVVAALILGLLVGLAAGVTAGAVRREADTQAAAAPPGPPAAPAPAHVDAPADGPER